MLPQDFDCLFDRARSVIDQLEHKQTAELFFSVYRIAVFCLKIREQVARRERRIGLIECDKDSSRAQGIRRSGDAQRAESQQDDQYYGDPFFHDAFLLFKRYPAILR